MSLLSRRDYMSQLAIEDCDICHEPMTDPARTNCRHFYCFECLKAWLESHNTCPTCRAKLFEETEPRTVQDAEQQGGRTQTVPEIPAGQRMETVRNLNEMIARLRILEASVSRLQEPQTPAPAVDRATEQRADQSQSLGEMGGVHGAHRAAAPADEEGELSYDAIVAYSQEFQARAEQSPPTVTFEGIAMSRLLERLVPEQHARPDWHEQLRTRAVRYTFTVEDEVARLSRASCDPPSWARGISYNPANRPLVSAYCARQREWFRKVRDVFRSVSAETLSREVHRLMREEVDHPLEELRLRITCL